MKKLYRIQQGKILFGVCTGLGQYFNIDPVIIRLLWILLGFCGVGVFAYLIAAIIIPSETSF